MASFPIIFQDDYLVVIHKPAGYLVHRTKMSSGRDFVLQTLRDQLGKKVFPVHRLDRQASGLLVMALSSGTASELGKIWMDGEVQKGYTLMVRGWIEEEGRIDRPLKRERDGIMQFAETNFVKLGITEIPIAVGPYTNSRYSLVKAFPKTGRMHQLRRHLAGIGHPVLGCAKHGDYRHNKTIEKEFGIKRLHLVATSLAFRHPFTDEMHHFTTNPDSELTAFWKSIGFPSESIPDHQK